LSSLPSASSTKGTAAKLDYYMEWPIPFQLTSHLVTPSLYYVSNSPLSFVLMYRNPHPNRQNHSSLLLHTRAVVEKISDMVETLFLKHAI
jgi:hypothetical protein